MVETKAENQTNISVLLYYDKTAKNYNIFTIMRDSRQWTTNQGRKIHTD